MGEPRLLDCVSSTNSQLNPDRVAADRIVDSPPMSRTCQLCFMVRLLIVPHYVAFVVF